MKKKHNLIKSIVLVIIVAAITFISQPKYIVYQKGSCDIYQVVYNGEDVTERVDCSMLALIVSMYKCDRLPQPFAPLQDSQMVVELNGNANNKALHIVLGEVNVAYESGHKGGYSIQNSEDLLTEIISLIQ